MTETVVVACKIPSGLRCQIYAFREVTETTNSGTRTYKQAFQNGKGFVVHGPAHGQNEGPRHLTIAGYALTRGIDKALWDAWYEQNLELDAVQRNLIFAYESADKAKDAAKEGKKIKTGLERLNPHALPKLDARFELRTAEENASEIGAIDLE
jgi:hypothetical protein